MSSRTTREGKAPLTVTLDVNEETSFRSEPVVLACFGLRELTLYGVTVSSATFSNSSLTGLSKLELGEITVHDQARNYSIASPSFHLQSLEAATSFDLPLPSAFLSSPASTSQGTLRQLNLHNHHEDANDLVPSFATTLENLTIYYHYFDYTCVWENWSRMERLHAVVLAPSGLKALLRLPTSPSPFPKIVSLVVDFGSLERVGGRYLPLLHQLLRHPASEHLKDLRLGYIYLRKRYRHEWEAFVEACEKKGIGLTWEDWHEYPPPLGSDAEADSDESDEE